MQRERCHRCWQYDHRHWPKQKVSHVINMSDKRAGKAFSHDLASRNKAPTQITLQPTPAGLISHNAPDLG